MNYPKGQKPLKNWDNYPTTSGYGERPDPFCVAGCNGNQACIDKCPKKYHWGIDKGCNGIVTRPWRAGRVVAVYGSIGEVYIDHTDAKVGNEYIQTIYAHGKDVVAKTGQQVTESSKIFLTDSKGNVTGPHLHFGARLKPSNQSIDPNLLFRDGTMAANYNLEKRGNDLWMKDITGDHNGVCFITRGGRTTEITINTSQGRQDRKLIGNMDPLVYSVNWAYVIKEYNNVPAPPPTDWEGKYKECEKKLKTAMNDIIVLEEEKKQLEAKVAKLEKEAITSSKTIEGLNLTISEKDTKIENQKTEIKKLTEDVANLKKKLEACEAGSGCNLLFTLSEWLKNLKKQ